MKKTILILCLAVPLCADYVTLKTGEQYIGEIIARTDDEIVIETVDSRMRIETEGVAAVTEAVSVVSLYKEKKAQVRNALDHYDLAMWCYDNDYQVAGDMELALASQTDPEVEAKALSREAEQNLLADLTDKEKTERALALKRTVSSLRNLAGTERGARYEQQLADYTAAEKAPVFIRQLNYTSPKYENYRGFLLDQLKNISSVDPKVYARHLLKEPSETLREKTYGIITAREEDRAMLENMMLDQFTYQSGQRRCNAIETMGRLHSSRGVVVLVHRLQQIWGASARSHFFSATQHAYIRDVTPVVADQATSFDPEVDTYTTGTVLDVKMHSAEREMIIRTLQQITDTNYDQPAQWMQWWENAGKDRYTVTAKE